MEVPAFHCTIDLGLETAASPSHACCDPCHDAAAYAARDNDGGPAGTYFGQRALADQNI